MRIGHGYDTHRFANNRRLVIGGEKIEHTQGLDGHSDADVLCHAISDALLGAAALGDIGAHFPPSDAQYKDANSIELLRRVGDLLASRGYSIRNIDATIIAEQPWFAPHIDAMRGNIAAALDIEVTTVSVKATTEEGMGFTGRREGIAVHAVCLIE